MVHVASDAADLAAKEGIECEILDLRTVSPLDEDSILESVEKTGRLVVVDEASPRCNIATDVSALVAQKGFASLKAPIRMVTPPHTPVPFSDVLEDEYLPNPGKISAAVLDVMRYNA
jgi:pyruvate dehydrogenase E1 component beta subunit